MVHPRPNSCLPAPQPGQEKFDSRPVVPFFFFLDEDVYILVITFFSFLSDGVVVVVWS